MMDKGGSGGVLRLRNLAMVENIRRAEDPARRDRLERQEVWPSLDACSAASRTRFQAMHDHAAALKEDLRRALLR